MPNIPRKILTCTHILPIAEKARIHKKYSDVFIILADIVYLHTNFIFVFFNIT